MISRHTCALSAREAQNGLSEGSGGLYRPLEDASEREIWVFQGASRNCRYGRTLRIEPFVGFFNTLLELAAGLRLLGRSVIVGYANHELLCLGAASVNAIASGTWMNVRAFSPDRFLNPDEEEIKRKAVWYYSPSSLSEYKPAFLDVAQQRGVLASLAPPAAYGSTYAAPLFTGVQPSSVGFGEPEAFRHYLQCMLHQARGARLLTFDATLAKLRQMLDAAEGQARNLARNGVLPQNRGFSEAFDTVRSALSTLEATRGPMLRRAWARV